MPRLKSRSEFPVGGFQFTQPQTNWSARSGSFTSVVTQVIQHRMGNRAITGQYKLSTDQTVVENEVDEFNAKRMVSMGHLTFVVEAPVQNFPRPTAFKSLSQNVVGKSKAVVAGVRSIAMWLGDGLIPVAQGLAEQRAGVCAVCPLNGSVNFTEEVMAQIREWIAIKNDLALKTSHDAKLGTCLGCSCDLKTKVFVPLKIVNKVMDPEIRGKLHPACWILLESENQAVPQPA